MSVIFHCLSVRTLRVAVKLLLVLSDSAIAPEGSTSAMTWLPLTSQAEGTAAFQEVSVFGSTTVGTADREELMVRVLVVAPLTKRTRTCGVSVLVLFAFTNTRTQALRSFTSGMLGVG